VTGSLAARGIDQPQLGQVAILAVAWVVPFGDEQPGEHAGFAQQPLEALMRRRLPPVRGATPIGVDAGRLDADQELPASFAAIQFPDRPGGAQRRLVLGQTHE
jgi:hypothetical protein